MIVQSKPATPGRGVRITGIALVLIGAVVAGASAASARFDLGEDLELGRAVHDVDGGPVLAWIAAALLLAVAGIAVMDAKRAARWLTWIGIGAAVAAVVGGVGFALVDRGGGIGGGLAAIPFVVAFFSAPALVTSLLLRQLPEHEM